MAVWAGAACPGGARYQFTARQGYCNGNACYYIVTDVTNSELARTLFVNYTPLLTNALYNAYLPQVYQVTNYAQNWVFSAESSPTTLRTDYMPVWILYTVTWYSGKTPTLLKSVAQINAARAAGKLTVARTVNLPSRTSTVVGASIVVNSAGVCIRQGSYVKQGETAIVTLPVFALFVGGSSYRMLMLDFANRAEAQAYGGNYAPNMAQFNAQRMRGLPYAWQNVYSIWSVPQLPVGREVPSPFGWLNANPYYSPLMNEYTVKQKTYPPPLYTDYAAIWADRLKTSATTYFNYQPVLGQ
jgi:hypothetical protein